MFPYREYFLKVTIFLVCPPDVSKNLHATAESVGETAARRRLVKNMIWPDFHPFCTGATREPKRWQVAHDGQKHPRYRYSVRQMSQGMRTRVRISVQLHDIVKY